MGCRSTAEIAERVVEQADAGGRGTDPGSPRRRDPRPARGSRRRWANAADVLSALSARVGRAPTLRGGGGRLRGARGGEIGADGAKLPSPHTFGRKLGYYDGFVFDLHDPARPAAGQVAGGGRYDGLTLRLRRPRGREGVGFAVYGPCASEGRHDGDADRRHSLQGAAAGNRPSPSSAVRSLAVRQARGGARLLRHHRGVAGASVQFRSASEIAREIGAGNVHLAVTGVDLLHETLDTGHDEIRPGADLGNRAPETGHIVTKLGFGMRTWVVAVPQGLARRVETMADLADVAARFRPEAPPSDAGRDEIRVADAPCSSPATGVHDYPDRGEPGATEGAPAAGTAELIVDITSTGRTLVENG